MTCMFSVLPLNKKVLPSWKYGILEKSVPQSNRNIHLIAATSAASFLSRHWGHVWNCNENYNFVPLLCTSFLLHTKKSVESIVLSGKIYISQDREVKSCKTMILASWFSLNFAANTMVFWTISWKFLENICQF